MARWQRWSDHALDRIYDVDTMAISDPADPHAYDPTPWRTIWQIFKRLGVDLEGATFIDFGCGKGRTLLSAMPLPFGQIIGVEKSPVLAAIAERNIASARWLARWCQTIRVVCQDASQFALPNTESVLFFYNPFPLPTMEQVLDNVIRSHAATPRPLCLIFYACSFSMTAISDRLANHAQKIMTTQIGKHSVEVFQIPYKSIKSPHLIRP